MVIIMTFGQKLKSLREKKGITQRELADLLNITRSRLSLYEIDDRQPDHDLTVQIANFFGVSTDYLLGNTSKVERNSRELTPEEKEDWRERFKNFSAEDQKEWLAWFIDNFKGSK